jgi:hypothetical protein
MTEVSWAQGDLVPTGEWLRRTVPACPRCWCPLPDLKCHCYDRCLPDFNQVNPPGSSPRFFYVQSRENSPCILGKL